MKRNAGKNQKKCPMQWSAEKNAGFSQAEPWIEVQKNYKTINTEVEEKQSDTILNFYKKLIQLRKELPVIANGTIYSDGKVDGTLEPYECKVMRSI